MMRMMLLRLCGRCYPFQDLFADLKEQRLQNPQGASHNKTTNQHKKAAPDAAADPAQQQQQLESVPLSRHSTPARGTRPRRSLSALLAAQPERLWAWLGRGSFLVASTPAAAFRQQQQGDPRSLREAFLMPSDVEHGLLPEPAAAAAAAAAAVAVPERRRKQLQAMLLQDSRSAADDDKLLVVFGAACSSASSASSITCSLSSIDDDDDDDDDEDDDDAEVS
jgi:hypothetical protein